MRRPPRREHPSSSVPVSPFGPLTLDRSYDLCRTVNRRHGTTFYWSTRLLPSWKRRHVHALYAFARCADEIVDELPSAGRDPSVAERQASLEAFGDRFFVDLDSGRSDHPLLQAVVHTVSTFDIDPNAFRRFLRSMTMDLRIGSYDTWDDLLRYMDGSAAVIGEMMLPLLEPTDLAAAMPHARGLGNAFQLTNFLRDIAEDLDRGRQYLPQEDLRMFDVDLMDRRVTPGFVDLMRFEISRCRDLYVSVEPGIAMLSGRSERCIRAAHAVYSSVLDRIEERDYDVFGSRVSISTPRKLGIAARELIP